MTEATARETRESGEPSISVCCPACGKAYTISDSSAGKSGRCKCGAVFAIPGPAAGHPGEHHPPARELRPEAADAERAEARPDEGLTKVRVGCIGRGHAGKTALLRALSEGPLGDFFPSGLHVDAGDPRGVAQMIREAEEAQRLLHQCGLPPTLEASQYRYALYEGDEPRVLYKLHEVIGQVLSHTLPDSAADLQARYAQYLRHLVNTHVLWAVIPSQPANPSARDRRRYANDLHITLAYLREALRLRSLGKPVAVALVLSKIDVLCKDAEEARATLTDEVLRASFGPLVHLIEQSPRVSDAVVIPVTAFGFGNAVLREEGVGREGAPSAEDDPFASEPIWLLREGASAQPYNLDTLFLWTLLYGLVNRAGDGAAEGDVPFAPIRQTLSEDLAAIDPWLLPLKGRVAGEEGPTPQVQGAR
jgi:hypothetical protein